MLESKSGTQDLLDLEAKRMFTSDGLSIPSIEENLLLETTMECHLR